MRLARAAFAVLLLASEARADPVMQCPAMEGASRSLEAVDARVRLGFVRDLLHDQASRARRWSLAWGLGGTGLAAGSFVLAGLAETRDEHIDPIVGGVSSLFIP